jgi:pimeloyl-ACP methyl ester carboxylesterase
VPEIELAQGTVRYRDEGSGPPIVFVHGALVDGRLWEPVVDRLASVARCVVPDLPLGAHRIAMRPDADVSPTGLAQLIADLLSALDLRDVTLVGNDTGGALCQLTVTRRPERIGRLVLTNCDAFDNFPPAMFRGLVVAARLRLLAAVRPEQLLDNAARLSEFDRPVLLAWAPEDRFFPLDHARRLAAIFPDARLVEVPDAYAFVSLDQPERLAALIAEFAG